MKKILLKITIKQKYPVFGVASFYIDIMVALQQQMKYKYQFKDDIYLLIGTMSSKRFQTLAFEFY